jgi:hypothetical protein
MLNYICYVNIISVYIVVINIAYVASILENGAISLCPDKLYTVSKKVLTGKSSSPKYLIIVIL